ncbi:MAG: hypothetical protein ACOZAA_07010 [Pseudomonadota bacterium]
MRSRNSGPRSNAWSRSKYTNQTSFDPQLQETGRIFELFFDDWTAADQTIYRQMPLHPDFLMPVTLDEVREAVSQVPSQFTAGLEAIVLLGGSVRQRKAAKTYCYGRYMLCQVIVLHPFPKLMLRREFKRGLRPDIRVEYIRAGASVIEKNGARIVEFTESALRDFYLRDVLMHEIGHHADRKNLGKKPLRKEEGFADWFALEYGFRLRGFAESKNADA